MYSKKSGFTIVELLIVIVVIAILAAISVVVFNGVQTRAQNASRISELQSWQKLFEVYKASYGSYPKPSPSLYSANGFCLGTGFPGETNSATGEGGLCHDNNAPVNVALNNEIKKAGSLPAGIRTPTKSGALGVYAEYWGYECSGQFCYSNTVELVQMFDGSAACPKPTYEKYAYTSGSSVITRMCAVRLNE